MILKVIFILCLICFAFGTDIKQVGNFDTSIENPLQNYAVSQNFQEKDETAHLYDSHNWFKTVKNGGSNQKQMRQKKEKFNLLSCCFKKSKENKSKTKDESNTKIKIKAKNNFDQARNNHKNPLEGIQMIRKSSAPTQRISAPIMLSRKFSSEQVKSVMLLSRRTSGESVKSAVILSRRSSAESVNSDESVKLPVPKLPLPEEGRRYTAKWKDYLGNPIVSGSTPFTKKEKVQETLEENVEQSFFLGQPRDIRSYTCNTVLLYACLDENVENCEKCKKLQQIFKSKNSEEKYLLYNLPIQKIQNTTDLDLQNIPTWLELVLMSILAEKQDMTLRITLNLDNDNDVSYKSKPIYSRLLLKNARVQPQGGHIFFSVLKSKFLDEDLKFFLENEIIKKEDIFFKIGESEGIRVIDDKKYVNAFLFNGILEEDIVDNTPTVGSYTVSNQNIYLFYDDEADVDVILQGTLLTIEKIDPLDSWILVSYEGTEGKKKESWINPKDFMNVSEHHTTKIN